MSSSSPNAVTNDGPHKGLDPRADKTYDGYDGALYAYSFFAKEQKVKLLEDWTKEDVVQSNVEKTLGQFAGFLIFHEYNEKGKRYTVGSMLQRLSGAKTYLSNKFGAPSYLDEKHPDGRWYVDLRHGLNNRARAFAIKKGEAILKEANALRRKLLKQIGEALLEDGSKQAMESRALLMMLYHAVGRAGEVSTINFDLFRWDDDDEAVWVEWGQQKTGRTSPISLHPDAEGPLVDVIHALACYIVSAGDIRNRNVDEPHWLFPSVASLVDGGASSKANRILEKLRGKIPDLCAGHTSHGLRAGATDDMANNYLCHLVCMIARGDWDWKGECTLFSYLQHKVHVATAGKTLAGWQDPRMMVASPQLEAIIDEEDMKLLLKLVEQLFFFAPDELQKPPLIGFRNVMAASLLMYFEDMEAIEINARKENPRKNNNTVLSAIKDNANGLSIPLAKIRAWGQAIKSDFKTRNILNQRTTGTEVQQCSAAVRDLAEEGVKDRKEVQAMKAELEAAKAELKEAKEELKEVKAELQANKAENKKTRTQLDRMEQLLEQLARSSVGSPSRKRAKTVDTRSDEGVARKLPPSAGDDEMEEETVARKPPPKEDAYGHMRAASTHVRNPDWSELTAMSISQALVELWRARQEGNGRFLNAKKTKKNRGNRILKITDYLMKEKDLVMPKFGFPRDCDYNTKLEDAKKTADVIEEATGEYIRGLCVANNVKVSKTIQKGEKLKISSVYQATDNLKHCDDLPFMKK
eukprot:CAMPEP_0194065926 /NCGR_PEP_ID=MMETSP0009_2-20130614/85740_1 /TAXON_ID=210454 /ORGANISM="Grammatophora oceanica, Strain CCMP 410" /LENGTH=749 /DNA_ID=CAMNT_0038718827 /DNA_START=67 /DNA_END=2316 /DNA_ORIENTATION=+